MEVIRIWVIIILSNRMIIGICMEVHRILGIGHNENVYGDALEYEFKIEI